LGSFCLTWCNGDLNGAEKQLDTSLEIANFSWNQQEEISENTEKALVLVFSPTGNTKKIASFISEITDSDLTEILPMIPYTEEDLNYNVKDSRANNEQNDSHARPEIATEISLEGYDKIYLGYPIWWWDLPMIVYTFLDNHDFSWKKVYLFNTHEWSGNSWTYRSLKNRLSTADVNTDWLTMRWQDARKDSAKSEVEKWLKGLWF